MSGSIFKRFDMLVCRPTRGYIKCALAKVSDTPDTDSASNRAGNWFWDALASFYFNIECRVFLVLVWWHAHMFSFVLCARLFVFIFWQHEWGSGRVSLLGTLQGSLRHKTALLYQTKMALSYVAPLRYVLSFLFTLTSMGFSFLSVPHCWNNWENIFYEALVCKI